MRKLLTVLFAAGAIAVPVGLTSAAEPPGEPALATCFWEGPISTKRPRPAASTAATSTSPRSRRPTGSPASTCPRTPARPATAATRTGATCRSTPTPTARRPTRSATSGSSPDPGITNPFLPGARRDAAKRSWQVRCSTSAAAAGRRARRTRSTRSPAAGASIELALPRLRARPRARPDRRHRPAAAGAHDAGRQHGEARRRLRGDQRPRPLDHRADDARRRTGRRARDPALRPADQPRLRPAALGALLQHRTTRTLAVVSDCTEAGRAGAAGEEPELAGRLLLEPRQRLHLRAPRPRVRPRLRRRGEAAADARRRDARPAAHARGADALLVAVHRRVAGDDPHARLPRGPPGAATAAARNYTVVVSRRADRPANARPRCGVAWLDWGEPGRRRRRPRLRAADHAQHAGLARASRSAIQRVDSPGTSAR